MCERSTIMFSAIQNLIGNLIIWINCEGEVFNNFAKGVVAGNVIVSNGGGVYADIIVVRPAPFHAAALAVIICPVPVDVFDLLQGFRAV